MVTQRQSKIAKANLLPGKGNPVSGILPLLLVHSGCTWGLAYTHCLCSPKQGLIIKAFEADVK